MFAYFIRCDHAMINDPQNKSLKRLKIVEGFSQLTLRIDKSAMNFLPSLKNNVYCFTEFQG